jgi:hypothetical protein
MTADSFRRLALALPEAIEARHMQHPDFRIRGKIFATLWADNRHGMVKLTPDQQSAFVAAAPAVFAPVKGAWGARGCTSVKLSRARTSLVRAALVAAWGNAAPPELAQQLEDL